MHKYVLSDFTAELSGTGDLAVMETSLYHTL